ncbi:60S ribosomal protein L14 [Trichinella murrelli]|uniref:Large ribosomal subunit protein eL14 n=1 Tax=Trichinella murrelli TaxID=144512 RepID=A0A0V0TXA6_9BILA|nr:60S ribosomal protein L14 [Trichinella murrelli]
MNENISCLRFHRNLQSFTTPQICFEIQNGIFDVLVQIGRVIYIARGRERGKLAVIVNVVDGNRALVDGPGLKRQMINFKNMLLTKMTLKITHYDKTKAIIAAWEKANINELWSKTKLAQSRRRRALRAKMSDFDRFKLMKAKQARNRILKREFERVKILHKRAEKKAKQSINKLNLKPNEGVKLCNQNSFMFQVT